MHRAGVISILLFLILGASNAQADVPNPEPDPACAGSTEGACCSKSDVAGVCLSELGVLVCDTNSSEAMKQKYPDCFGQGSSSTTGATTAGGGNTPSDSKPADSDSGCSMLPIVGVGQRPLGAGVMFLMVLMAMGSRRRKAAR